MNVDKILAIAGKPGLFELKIQTRSGFLAESLLDGKKITVGMRSNVSLLTEISMYTYSEEKPLVEIMRAIAIKENEGPAISHKEDNAKLVAYFKQKGIKIHLVSFKDFYKDCASEFKNHAFANVYEFNTQPNMIFELPSTWLLKEDYYNSFSKKYRDQYKRAHKKFEGISVKELDVDEVVFHETRIN